MRQVHASAVKSLQCVSQKLNHTTSIGAGVKQEIDACQMKIEQSNKKLDSAKKQFGDASRKL